MEKNDGIEYLIFLRKLAKKWILYNKIIKNKMGKVKKRNQGKWHRKSSSLIINRYKHSKPNQLYEYVLEKTLHKPEIKKWRKYESYNA